MTTISSASRTSERTRWVRLSAILPRSALRFASCHVASVTASDLKIVPNMIPSCAPPTRDSYAHDPAHWDRAAHHEARPWRSPIHTATRRWLSEVDIDALSCLASSAHHKRRVRRGSAPNRLEAGRRDRRPLRGDLRCGAMEVCGQRRDELNRASPDPVSSYTDPPPPTPEAPLPPRV